MYKYYQQSIKLDKFSIDQDQNYINVAIFTRFKSCRAINQISITITKTLFTLQEIHTFD